MSATPYLTTVNYTCGPGALLIMVRNILFRLHHLSYEFLLVFLGG